jgi:hypothetical protein
MNLNAVQVTLTLPREIAANIQNGGNVALDRRLLELAAVQAHKAGLITEREVMEMLGFEDREDLYAFFKAYDVRATHINLQQQSEKLAALLVRHNR